MGKFKVGDKVSVCVSRGWVNGTVVGCYKAPKDGYVVEVPNGYGWYITRDEVDAYAAACGAILKVKERCYWNATESSMLPPKNTEERAFRPKRRIVIEITDDGAEAKYIVGKNIEKTASIKRHPNDKPDDEMAAMFVMQKLFGYNLRNIEKAADEKIRLNEEAIRWICDAKEALDEAEKRTRKLLN